MVQDSKKDFIELLDTMKHGVKKQKVNQMIAAIKNCIKVNDVSDNVPQNSIQDFDNIMIIVSRAYNIRPDIIITTKRRGEFYFAKKMCFCLLSDCLGYTALEIAKIFKRNQTQIQFELTSFSKLDKKNKVDLPIINKYEALRSEFLTQKNN